MCKLAHAFGSRGLNYWRRTGIHKDELHGDRAPLSALTLIQDLQDTGDNNAPLTRYGQKVARGLRAAVIAPVSILQLRF